MPERFRGPNAGDRPIFLQVDFGLVRGDGGRIEPKLVELQAFASLYGFQLAVAEAYRDAFQLSPALGLFLGGLDARLLSRASCGRRSPAGTIRTRSC